MPEKIMIKLDMQVARSEDILTSEVDGDVVMMSIEQGTYSGLDKIGSEIWQLLEKPMQVADICSEMMARYNVEKDICEKDVLTFLNDLASDGTIHVIG